MKSDLFFKGIDLIKKQPKLLVFPFLSWLLSVLTLTIFSLPFYFQGTKFSLSGLPLVILFIFTFITITIATYFNSGIIACVKQMFEGHAVDIQYGFEYISKYGKKLFLWALISATFGFLIKVLRRYSRNISWLFPTLLAGVAWSILTYFILPVLLFENKGIFTSIQQSGSLFKKAWGEVFVQNFSLGLFSILFYVIGFIPLILILTIKPSPTIVAFVVIICISYLIAVGIFFSAVSMILRTALYIYATTGKVPLGFNTESLKNAFTKPKSVNHTQKDDDIQGSLFGKKKKF